MEEPRGCKEMNAVQEEIPLKEECSVSFAELTAQSALQQYHSNVCGKLLGEALVESSDLAAKALEELTQAHTRTVEQLNAQIAGLQKELLDAVSFIEKIGGQALGEKETSSLRLSSLPPLSMGRTSFALDVHSSLQEKSAGENAQECTELSGLPVEEEQQRLVDEKHKRHLSSFGEAVSESFFTAKSVSCGIGGSFLTEGDTSHSVIVAEALQGRGTIRLQQQQQISMLAQLKELTTFLAKAVKENATYRMEVQLLRATSVPMKEHLRLMSERDALEQECNSMRLEIKRLEAELGAALSIPPSTYLLEEGTSALVSSIFEKEAPELLQKLPLPPTLSTDALKTSTGGSCTTKEGVDYLAHGHIVSNVKHAQCIDENELRHTALWKTAIRELEQQATIAATQLSAAERLREAEEQIEKLQAFNVELRTSLENLEAEDQCVRSDCEHLTFRNAVLSQQVASLLVKVEQQRRALERQGQKIQEELPLYDGGDESLSDAEIILEGEEHLTQSGSRARRGRVALAAQSLLERRGTVSAFLQRSEEGASGDYGDPLDATLRPVGVLEVEGGVKTGLDVFARSMNRRRRSVALRNMGFQQEDTDITRVPQLPATDKLSGVALGRVSQFATIDLARGAAHAQSRCARTQQQHHRTVSGSGKNDSKSSGSSAKSTVFSNNSEENQKFLEILREDENLDRYSINSVAELLKRNQELLQQLYVVTQRVNYAEQLQREDESKPDSVASETEAARLGPKENRKRGRDELIGKPRLQQEKRLEDSASEGTAQEHAMINSENFWSENSFTEGNVRERHVQNNLRRQQEEEEKGNNGKKEIDNQFLQLERETRYIQLEEHVDNHIETILQKYATHFTLTDNTLAASLLQILETVRKDDNEDGCCNKSFLGKADSEDSDFASSNAMKDAFIASLLRLFTEQGIRAANQAVTLATALQSRHADVIQKCWDDAQLLLRGSTAELQAAADSLLRAAYPVAVKPSSNTAADALIKNTNSGGKNMYNEAQLLHNIASLLRTASLKEHTIQRVLRLAARQQRLVRCVAAKQQEDENKAREREGVEEEEKDEDGVVLEEEEDEFCDDQYTLKRLRARIDGMQTRYDELLALYNHERKQHTALLDRIWRLEEEKVDAVRSRNEALERMSSMMTREDYEATIDALDTTKSSLEDLKAKLHHAQDSSGQQLLELDRWRLAAAELERQRAEDAAVTAAQIAQKDSLIAQHVQYNYELEARNAEQQVAASMLETQVAQQRGELVAKEEEMCALRKHLRRVELALLEQQCTQDLLFAIFPGDRALVESRNLIEVIRGEKERLAEKAAALQLDLDEAHRQLQALRLQIHGVEQARQEAELRLQEAGFARTLEMASASLLQPIPAVATATEPTTTVKETEAMELEMLRHANVSLLFEKREWMERETLLRERLDALSHDPVSKNARRYGLKAIGTFEEQLAELHERCVALEEQVATADELRQTVAELRDEIERQEVNLANAKNDLATQQKVNEALLNKLSDMELRLQEKEESHDAVKLTLSEKEEMINKITGAITTLEEEGEKMMQRLQTSEQERQRLYGDNLKLIDAVSGLTEEVKKKEEERKAAQSALAQGLALVKPSPHRLRGRSGGPPTPITSSLNKNFT